MDKSDPSCGLLEERNNNNR